MRLFAARWTVATGVFVRFGRQILDSARCAVKTTFRWVERWNGRRFAAQSLDVGEWGEWWAMRALRRRGYRILFRRWSDGAGELDLIAWRGDQLVFVEVKARRATVSPGGRQVCRRLANDALQAVDREKQGRITRAALRFKKKHRLLGYPTRFDIVVVVATDPCRPVVQHWKNAFDATDDLGSMY